MTDISAPSPAVGTSLLINLGGDRQLTLQCFFPLDSSEDEGNGLIDKLLRFGDRAKARYDLEAMTEQFSLVGLQLQNLIDGMPLAEHKYRESQETLVAEIRKLEADKATVLETGYADFRAKGRLGDYKPSGAIASRGEALARQIAGSKVKIEENERERDGYRQQIIQTIKHHQQDLAKRRLKIDSLRKLVGQEPNTDFLETEQYEPPTE